MNLRNHILLAATVCLMVGCGSKAAPTQLERVGQLLAEKRVEEALQLCESILRENPSDYQALLLRGEAHRAAKQLDEAILDFTAAIEIQPDTSEAYYRRATVYQAKSEQHRLQSNVHAENGEREQELAENQTYLRFLELQVADDSRARARDPNFGVAYSSEGPPLMDLESLEGGQVDLEVLDPRAPEDVPEIAASRPNSGDAINDANDTNQANTTSPKIETPTNKTPYQKMTEQMAEQAKRKASEDDAEGDQLADIPAPPPLHDLDDVTRPLPKDREPQLLDAPPRQIITFGIPIQGQPSISPLRPKQVTTGIRSDEDLPPAQGRFYLQQGTPNQYGLPAPPSRLPATTGITSGAADSASTSANTRFTAKQANPVGRIGLGSNLPFGPQILTPDQLQNQRPPAAPVWGTAPNQAFDAGRALGPRWGTAAITGSRPGLPGAIPTAPNGTPQFAPDLTDPNFTPFVPIPAGFPSVEIE